VVADGRQIGPAVGSTSTTLVPASAVLGGSPRFVMLHFTGVNLPGSDKLTVGDDEFTSGDGADVWSRPIDPLAGPVVVSYVGSGAAGVATLAEYGSGEPVITGSPPGPFESRTNPDPFFHTNPYVEPVYETRLECDGAFDWANAATVAGGTPQRLAVDATCILFSAHPHGSELVVSSCTGTLIDTDLVITAHHCFDAVGEVDVRSASVTFDYLTAADGSAPPGHDPKFYKVTDVVQRNAADDWIILRIALPPGGTGVSPRPLRSAPISAGEPIQAVHHPNGAVKKVQFGTAAGISGTVSGFDYAGGSSGSGLFDGSGRLIGAALSNGSGCVVSYPTSRGVLNDLANPPAPPNPLDVILVLDRSGSMSGPAGPGASLTKLEDAQDAADLFVELVRVGAGDRIGLVSFSSTAGPPTSAIGAVTTAKKTELRGSVGTPGTIDQLVAGGMTSIGGALQAAMGQLASTTTNDPVILLLTDGLQNQDPMIEAVESSLGDTELCVIGFGREEQLNGPLLSRVAREHDGLYTRAADGLALRKFFALCFGNIFQSGALADPTQHLKENQVEGRTTQFEVCGESEVTIVVGWDERRGDLDAVITSPSGATITAATAGVESAFGPTWWFLRLPLPHEGDRDGVWQLQVRRRPTSSEFPDRAPLEFFSVVVGDGGPTLKPVRQTQRVYTGDVINPMVVLRNADGTRPPGNVTVTIERPDGSLGQLVADAGLSDPGEGDDPVDGFIATLQLVAAGSGGKLPIGTTATTIDLFDDGEHEDGAFESDGVYGNPVPDLTRHEGTYHFHARASYGSGDCHGMREAIWSVHVEPGIDPDRTTVVVPRPFDGGAPRVIRVTPRDVYGNPLGPGRGDRFDLTGVPGTTVTGLPGDNGDGSYDVPATWESGDEPGLVVTQPGRNPAVVRPEPPSPSAEGKRRCPHWLWCLLGLAGALLLLCCRRCKQRCRAAMKHRPAC
jgi:hypothetical protein